MNRPRHALLCALMLLLAHGLNAQTNTLTTIAGGGSPVGDGVAATSASLYFPGGMCMDGAGNVYVADQYQHRIRKIDPGTGIISTVAGTGGYGFSGDGGLAVNAALAYPSDVAVDAAGNLYIADQYNNRIRKVDKLTNIITTIGGNGTAGFSNTGVGQFYYPTGVDVDASGNVYVADNGNHRIRKIMSTGAVSTVAGTTTSGLSGDGGLATSAKLYGPRDIALDASGNIYIADYSNSRIRKVTGSTNIITTVAGTTSGFSGDGGLATAAQMNGAGSVAIDAAGNLYIADYNNYRVRKVMASNGIITTIAGSGTQGISGNGGVATAATIYTPVSVVLDASGNLYISDENGHQIRKVSATNIISHYAGYNPNGSGSHYDYRGFGELATKANITAHQKPARAANGDVYFVTTSALGQGIIAKVDAATGILSHVYGTADGSGTYPNDGGLATQTPLNCTDGIAMDASGDLYFSEQYYNRVRKINVSTGIITTILGDGTVGNINTGAGRVSSPRGVVLDAAGNVYVADYGNHRIRKVTPTGVKTTIAGTTSGFSGDGAAATSAKLSNPFDVAVDGAGNVYISDYGNVRVRKITAATGFMSTVAGNGTYGSTGDGGAATSASLWYVERLTVDSPGNIYLSQAYSSYGVRKIDAATGIINPVINENWDTGPPLTYNDGADALKTGLDDAGAVYVDASGLYAGSSIRLRKMIMATNSTITVGTDPAFNACYQTTANAIPYYTTGTYNAGNVFTLQLSDATGAFDSPTTVGSLASTGDGTIQATFPYNLVSSMLYRIRVVSSSPAVIGAASGTTYSLPAIPETTNQSATADLCTGSSIPFSVATGISPRTYQWYKTNVAVAGATSSSYTATLAGSYYVSITDAITGCAASTATTLVTGRILPAVPTITPATAQAICAGGSVTLTRNNVASTTYQWTQGAGTGGPTTGGGTPIAGATGLSYVAMPAASDSFRVVATNIYGCKRTSLGTMITVNPLPNVTVTPDGPTTFNIGGSVTLSVPVTAGVSYQWRKDGVAIGGATANSYMATAGGSYTVVATSSTSACTATSAATVVTVNSISASITPATPQTICDGNTALLSANSGAGYTYQWMLNGSPISGATTQYYSAGIAGDYTVVVNDGATSATSNMVNVTVLPLPNVTVTPAGPVALCTGGSVALTVTATTGAVYQWMLNGSAISGATSASYTAATAGSYTVMVISSAGCSALSAPVSVSVSNCAPAITSLSPATGLCQGGAVAVTFSATSAFNAGNVFTAQLSNAAGSFAAPVTIGTLSGTTPGTINATIALTQVAGTGYRIRVISSSPALTGAANGTNISVIAAPTAAQVVVSPTAATVICNGGSATLSVPNTAGFTYQWRVGGVAISGATANTYVAAPTATSIYSVIVTNASGCSRTSANKTVALYAPPAATVSPSTTQNLCGGVTSVAFSANTGTGLTYQWRNNGTAISGATASTYSATAAGIYSVTVTNSNGCSTTSAAVTVTANCGVAITNTGTQTVCAGSSITATFSATGFASGNVFTLQLSDASGSFAGPVTLGTLTGTSGTAISATIPAGTAVGSGYKLRINTSNPATTGAASPLTLAVQQALTAAQELCAVTVDDATGKNKLIWNKPATTNVDSFVFYRQNDMATYVRVGAQAYPVFSTWIDAGSAPANKAQRYYITAKNACGESAMGTANRTMHLTINKGTDDNTWNLIWNGYEGAAHTYYNIYRGTTPTGMALLGSLTAGSYNSYTDNTAPTGTIYYMVTVADAPACTPNRGTAGGDEIVSNIATNGVGGFAEWLDMTVYPNPSGAAGTLLIESSHADEAFGVRVMDVTGRVVHQAQAVAGTTIRFGEAFAPGIYTIEATSGSGKRVVKKWVKQ